MVSKGLIAALSGASLLQFVLAGDTTNTQLISSPTAQPTGLRTLKYAGCYNDASPMINHGPYTYQTSGNCQKICYLLGNTAMALSNGSDCWCGDMLPSTNSQISDDKCSTSCQGYPNEKCGGENAFTVYQTGFTLNEVQHANAASASQASASGSVRPTMSSSASASAAPKSGGNTVGIAIGVVVGIIVLAALCGAGFLFFRRRQQKQMEEYKKQVDAPPFTGTTVGGNDIRPSMWAPDNRLDGTTGGNRTSVGSIADNQDYSRKILQIRNPDGF